MNQHRIYSHHYMHWKTEAQKGCDSPYEYIAKDTATILLELSHLYT